MRTVPRASYDDSPPELLALGAAIRELRKSKGLKQIEVATNAGVTESQISDIERGKNNPGWLLLMQITVEGLGASAVDLAQAYVQASSEMP